VTEPITEDTVVGTYMNDLCDNNEITLRGRNINPCGYIFEPYRSILLNHDKREAERDELVMFVKWIRCGTDGDSHSVATGECIERAADLLKKLGV